MEHVSVPSAVGDWRTDLDRLAEPLRLAGTRTPLHERLLLEMQTKTPYLHERVVGEVTTLRNAFTDPLNTLTPELLENVLNQRLISGYREVATDLVLSHNGTKIQRYMFLKPIIVHELEAELVDPEAPRMIDHTGMIFLDVDGMKTIVDCTDHSNGCAYLQRLADILLQLPPSVTNWCQEHGIQTEAFSVAGDEFLVKVRSERPLEDLHLQTLQGLIEQAIVNDSMLRTQFVDFENPGFLLDYGFIGDDRREEVLSLESDDARRTALADVRSQLPAAFLPSVSMGFARFRTALEETVEQAMHHADEHGEMPPFSEVGFNAFQRMVQLADDRAAGGKRIKKQHMKETDPKLYAFLMRNADSRELLHELAQKDLHLKRIRHSLAKLRASMEAVLNDMVTAIQEETRWAHKGLLMIMMDDHQALVTQEHTYLTVA